MCIRDRYKDDIVIYKINVDNEKELASAFCIQSIPTLLFIPKTGKPQIARCVYETGVKKGAFDEATAETKFQAWLKNKQASVQAVKDKDSEAAKAAEKARLEAEKEANKAKAEIVAKKKAELAAAEAAKQAEEAAAAAPAEEAPAAESAE